ncbi:GNAT superfamily N-acetyltransferase [Symbiobacterium terraclitae]|uniref:GNAT superfamily N-acetyltransferase n=1 Tax=Symbiobacterium terraclitae TaxID=557451 RepID=A0ABS4JSL5_9FIRM|nr:GNAT family N-acetyltransferase [Symbiobacterium terraclitae]MBP2018522.1 GNAT superfamily N-acetyltransferase [Symbiobacterium terraclitae]
MELHLARRLERFRAALQVSFARTCARIYPDASPAWEDAAGGWAVYTHEGTPVNRAIGMGLDGPVTAAVLDRVESFYFDRGAPCQVDVTPFTHPSLLALLEQRGYRRSLSLHMLYCHLPGGGKPVDVPGEQGRAPGRSAADGIAVEAVPAEPDALTAWVDLVTAAFGYAVPPGAVNLIRISAFQPETTAFLARVDGRPAGGGVLQVIGPDAYLGSTAVLPALRHRGVHATLLRTRLAAAARAGCTLAQAQTEPGSASERNLLRAGFRVAYPRTTMVRACPQSAARCPGPPRR